MKPLKGISQDNSPIDMMEGFYFFGKNGVQGNTLGAVQNEEGFQLIAELPYAYNGKVVVDQSVLIFSTDDTNSEIGVLDTITEEYTTLYNDSAVGKYKLGFKKTNPISGTGKRDYLNNIVAVWRDGLNDPRIWNTGKDIVVANDIKLFPDVTIPQVTMQEESYGGSIPVGALYLFLQFEDLEGNTSPWIGEFPAIYLKGADGFGDKADISSGKSIQLTIENSDTSFDYINIAFVSKSDGIVSSKLYRKVENATTVTVSITGSESTQELLLEELIIPRAIYSDVTSFTSVNGILYGANVKQEPKLNLQQYANNIEVRWKSTPKFLSPTSPASYKTLPHEEVISLYIGFILKNSQTELIYHIPGRAKRTDLTLELTPEVTATAVDETSKIVDIATTAGVSAPTQADKDTFFLWDDTQVNPDVKLFQTRDTCTYDGTATEDGEDVYYGKPSFWENADEVYPSDATIWGALAGQKVRHHKLPSQRFMAENVYTLQSYGIQSMDTMQLEVVASSIDLPTEILDQLQGYRLYMAKRTPKNSLVLGQDLSLFAGRFDPNDSGAAVLTEDFSTVGNYDHEVDPGFPGSANVRLDASLAGGGRALPLRVHALDVLLNKPGVLPTYASVQYKLRYHHNDYEKVEFTDVDIDAEGSAPHNHYGVTMIKDALDEGYKILNVASDFTNQVRTVRYPTSGSDALKRHRTLAIDATAIKYTPQRLVNDLIYNDQNEEMLYARLKRADLFADGVLSKSMCTFLGNTFVIEGTTITTASTHNFRYPMFEDVLLMNLIAYKENVYTSYTDQMIMANSKVFGLTTNGKTTGDSWVSVQSFTTVGWHRVSEQNAPESGLRAHHTYLGTSVADPLARFQDGNKGSWFYPKSTYDYPVQVSRNDLVKYNYNKAFSGANDLTGKAIYNSLITYLSEFPFRVIKFGDSKSEERNDAWRVQTALDYYESIKNRGFVMNIQAIDDKLIIHYQHGFRITRPAGQMKDENGVIYALGSGNLFAIEPSEVGTSTVGFAGIAQHLNGVLTPDGYIFIDTAFNTIYKFTEGKGLEPMHSGLVKLLRKYFDTYRLADNPYASTGVLIEYDPRYNRIMFTIKGEVLPAKTPQNITFSYSIDTRSIAFFHDYTPTDYLPSRANLYSVKGTKIYRNSDGIKGQYYDDTIYPFFIDIAFSLGKDSGVINQVEWLTKVLDENEQEFKDKTFTSISVWNSHQTSGKVTITPHSALNIEGTNTSRNNKGYWTFDDLRNIAVAGVTQITEDIFGDFAIKAEAIDENKPWFDKELLEDNYFIVRFEYNNLDNHNILLHDVDVTASQSTL